jgi:hypothetical protein
MRRTTPFGDINIPVPGTDFYKWASALSDYLSLDSWSDAADIASKVQDAYTAASAAVGAPYIANDNTAGDPIVTAISNSTGLSFGNTKAALNVLQQLAATGAISNSTYNPNQYSLSARVSQAAQTAVSDVKSAAAAVVPQAVQDAVAGLGSGVSGIGSLLSYLPLLALAGLGLWGYQTYKQGKK